MTRARFLFRRTGEHLATPGTNLGGKLRILAEHGRFWLVRKDSATVGTARTYEPVQLMILRVDVAEGVEPGVCVAVEQSMPGAAYRSSLSHLQRLLHTMGSTGRPMPQPSPFLVAFVEDEGRVRIARNRKGGEEIRISLDHAPGLLSALRDGTDWGRVPGFVESGPLGMVTVVTMQRTVRELTLGADEVPLVVAALQALLATPHARAVGV
jgi:hypothetical protein